MQIIQPVAFNKGADELLYRLSTQGIKTLQFNMNTTSINIIFAGEQEKATQQRAIPNVMQICY
jgi:hypothetical protein